MKRIRCSRFWLVLGLVLGQYSGASFAQSTMSETARDQSNGAPPAVMPPMPPPARSPVDIFRELLDANPEQQVKLLAQRPPQSQELIRQKLREYRKLSPEERKLRLQVTELRFYLWPLLNLAPTNRPPLSTLPPSMTNMIAARLVVWDQVSPEHQREFLENEATVRYILELATAPLGQQAETLRTLSPARREQLEKWQAKPEEQRSRILQLFGQMFNLTPSEEKETLEMLSEAELRQIESTLKTFAILAPLQRLQCLRSFQKFKSLSAEERKRFIEDAGHWNLMTPSERQAWKDVVYNISRQPPLPPGLGGPPPLPPGAPRGVSTLIATNGP